MHGVIIVFGDVPLRCFVYKDCWVFLSSFFTFVKVATEHFNHAIVTRHLHKTFLAVGLRKSLFVAAGSKEYLNCMIVYVFCVAFKKKMFIDFFTLSMALYIEYRQPITPASFSYLIGILLSLIHLLR